VRGCECVGLGGAWVRVSVTCSNWFDDFPRVGVFWHLVRMVAFRLHCDYLEASNISWEWQWCAFFAVPCSIWDWGLLCDTLGTAESSEGSQHYGGSL
jgi:hypothetical protein